MLGWESGTDKEAALAMIKRLVGGPTAEKFKSAVEERIDELMTEVNQIMRDLTFDDDRDVQARNLISLLVPTTIDVKLWQDVALGRNIQLPASNQYGRVDERLRPMSPRLDAKAGKKPYGKVHSKGDQAPSAFMQRQASSLQANARKIAQLEQDLKAAQEEREELQAGLQIYALMALLTELRNAAAPVFAMGPAWTLLTAIQGSTGVEPSPKDQAVETQRILVVLHALRDHEEFQQQLKRAILDVCHRFQGEAHRRGKDTWTGPWDYSAILAGLGWPPEPDEFKRDVGAD